MNNKLEELKKNRKRNRIYTGRSQITFELEYFEYLFEKYENSTRSNFFSQKEFAEKIGCSRATMTLIIYEYINDREKFLKRIKKKE
jgi:hypothetical protein